MGLDRAASRTMAGIMTALGGAPLAVGLYVAGENGNAVPWLLLAGGLWLVAIGLLVWSIFGVKPPSPITFNIIIATPEDLERAVNAATASVRFPDETEDTDEK